MKFINIHVLLGLFFLSVILSSCSKAFFMEFYNNTGTPVRIYGNRDFCKYGKNELIKEINLLSEDKEKILVHFSINEIHIVTEKEKYIYYIPWDDDIFASLFSQETGRSRTAVIDKSFDIHFILSGSKNNAYTLKWKEKQNLEN